MISPTLLFLTAVLLFLLGLWLSAFFSGSETGFYRVSFLRLSLDAQAGDRIAQRLLWFVRHPSYFVATTLVGNNCANYLATLAIGLGTAAVVASPAWWMEIVGSVLVSPIIFVFGELMPKKLFFSAPMHLLRRGSWKFRLFYRLFLPISLPLIALSRLLEKMGHRGETAFEVLPGTERLARVLEHGRHAGLLTEVQGRLVGGLIHAGERPATEAMTPADRVLGVDDDADRQQVLDHARRYGISDVPVRRKGTEHEWYGYVRVIDAAVSRQPVSALICRFPEIDRASTRLEALIAMRETGTGHAVVKDEPAVLGVVSERGLVEQLFRTPRPQSSTPV